MLSNDKLSSDPAVSCFKIIKETLSMIDIKQSPLLPDYETSLICMESDVLIFLQVATVNGEDILKLEEFEVKNSNKGLGTLIMYIITKVCEVFNVKLGLWTTPGSNVAETWYEKLGFYRVDTLENNQHTWWEKEPSHKVRSYYLNKINNLVDLMDSLIELNYLHSYIQDNEV